MTGAVFGLAASLITFRELWAAARVLPPPPPPPAAVVENEEEVRQGEKGARAVLQEVEPYVVQPDTSGSGSASSYVETEAAQAQAF